MLSVFILNVMCDLCIVMLNVIMLGVVLLSVVMLRVVMLNVVVPLQSILSQEYSFIRIPTMGNLTQIINFRSLRNNDPF
jgi:hypothetical protein